MYICVNMLRGRADVHFAAPVAAACLTRLRTPALRGVVTRAVSGVESSVSWLPRLLKAVSPVTAAEVEVEACPQSDDVYDANE